MKAGIFLVLLFCPIIVSAQTGGSYQIEKTVIAAGGSRSAGGNYSLESTIGQTLAGGFLQASGFSAYSGFRTPVFAPTAAGVSVGGRVLTPHGQGIRNARVMLAAPDGTVRFSLTGSFGYYRFSDIPVGATYVLTVFSKRYVFDDPTLVVAVNEQLDNLDFTATEIENVLRAAGSDRRKIPAVD